MKSEPTTDETEVSEPTPSLSFSEHQHGFFAPVPPHEGPSAAETSRIPRAAADEPGREHCSDALSDLALPIDDYQAGHDDGAAKGSSLDFTVQIRYEDLKVVGCSDRTSPTPMGGAVMAPTLSSESLTVVRGSFVLLDPDRTRVETSLMTYCMDLHSVEGDDYELFGFKIIHEGPEWAAWRDSTTLHVTIRKRSEDAWRVIGRGITRVSVRDLVGLLASMRVAHAPGIGNGIRYKVRFGRVLGRSLFQHYGGTFDELGRFPPPPPLDKIPQPRGWKNSGGLPPTYLRTAGGEWFRYEGGAIPEDVCSRLMRYGGRDQKKGPVILAPGFSMPSWSLTTHTIDMNLVEYLIGAKYEVWLFDYHSASDLPSTSKRFTLDDIADDWIKAIEYVLTMTDRDDVQCVGHCVGSASLLMAVMRGAQGVRSMVCGQYTLFPYTSRLNLAKNYLNVGAVLAAVGVTGVAPDSGGGPKNIALDLSLRPVPLPRGEHCGLAMCRWINAIYGLTHTHTQLKDATHEELADVFGTGCLRPIRQIGQSMLHHQLVDVDGKTYLTDENVQRLTMPIHFCAGELNYIFHPQGTRESVAFLSDKNAALIGKDHYTASYFKTYAHLDTMIGRNAARDVYPDIVEQLNRHP